MTIVSEPPVVIFLQSVKSCVQYRIMRVNSNEATTSRGLPRLAYIVTRAHHGGAQMHVAELIRSFHLTTDLYVATGEEGYVTDVARACGVPVVIIPHLTPELSPRMAWNDLRALWEIWRWLGKVKPSIVHAHSSKAGGLGRYAAFLRRIPSVFTAHGWGFTEGVPRGQKLVMLPAEWLAARFTDTVITVSRADGELAERYRVRPRRQTVTIHNGLPAGVDVTSEAASTDCVRIVCVARFSAQKNQRLLVQALRKVESPWSLVFVGEGPMEDEVQKLVHELGLSDRVEFLGARDDVGSVLAGSDIFALPSNWEGLPLTILEAMRASLPVIASDVGGVSEVLVNDVTGYLVQRDDVEAFAEALERLVGDQELRDKFGKCGRERFLSDFLDTQMIASVQQVYSSICGPAFSAAQPRADRS